MVTTLRFFIFFTFLSLSHASIVYGDKDSKRFPEKPLVTIITSVYNSDEFIEGFLQDIVKQTIFPYCELLMIDANSPGKEIRTIKKYQEKYSNITYVKLSKDPGIYGVWNLGVKLARSKFLTNANTDDRLAPICYELHANMLIENPDVDLVYSDFYKTTKPNETFEENSSYYTTNIPDFEPGHMHICLPNNHPMWRLSMHDKYGLFDESFKSAGDWEMWCRAVEKGSIFKKVPGVLGLYYHNPKGLSTNKKKRKLIKKEEEKVRKRYGYFFYKQK